MSARLWTEEQFNCPVCLEIPTDPVTIPCGHSYCMACIADHWDTEERKTGIYSCPECRQTFNPKPTLCRNTMLAEAVEQLRRGNLSSSARESIKNARKAATNASARGGRSRDKPASSLSPSDVPCDRCAGSPKAAVKTCLVCMASFCEAHLKPHQTQAKLKDHELIAPTGDLTAKICAEHKYLQEFYCRQCQMYVCWLCTSNRHKGHECVSTQAERNERQKELAGVQSENQQRLQERERELKDMKKVLETLKRSSDTVNDEAETALEELQRSVQRMLELLQEVMFSTGEAKLNEAQEVVDKLEAEVKQLKKKDAEFKELVKSQDHIHFLQTYKSLCTPPEAGELGSVAVNPEATFEPIRGIVLELREKVEDMCNQELGKINKLVYSTTVFTVTEKDQKMGGFLKLFSGLNAKPAATRTQGPPPLPSVSVRGPGQTSSRSQDIRSRNQPRDRGVTNSPRPRDRQQREEREQADTWSLSSVRPHERQRREEREPERGRESPNLQRPQSRQSRSTNDDRDQADTWSLSSMRSQGGQRREERDQTDSWSLSSMRSVGRPRRDDRDQSNGESQDSSRPQERSVDRPQPERQSDTWSLSSVRSLGRRREEQSNGESQVSSRPQERSVDRAQPARQSDRWSLSSLLPRNRKKRQDRESVREATPDTNPWGTPTEVNPGLFLDSPSSGTMTSPGFPMLREIDISSIQAPEPRTRDELLQYACVLTLDPNTAHRRLALSEDNTVATLQQSALPYPDNPQRFDGWNQVMCLHPLSGERCYWEVEWRGRGSALGVAHGSMPRKGTDGRAGLGYNGQSWSLELSDMCCAAMHANQKREIPVTYSPRVGIYLDRSAGTLTFYSVDDPLTALHTFEASFPRPLFAAFGVGSGVGVGLDFAMGQFSATTDSIKICPL